MLGKYERVRGWMGYSITTDAYWDCECEKDFIHEKAVVKSCPKCGCHHDEQPDSLIIEVAALGLPIPQESINI